MRRATLLLALLLLAAAAVTAYSKSIEVHIIHARLGPVYQRLPDGTVIEVYADVYYPDKLYLHPPNVLGEVNFTVHTNWTGLWDGIITVMVVDPGYKIDKTLFKPTNSMWAWAEGGATIGAGDILAPEGAILNKTVTRRIQLVAYERYFRAKPGVYKAQYFFRIRLAFFDYKTGEKVPGGDINMYTVSSKAPYVEIIVPPKQGQSNGENTTLKLAIDAGIAAAIAAAAYIALEMISRKRRG